MRLRSKDGAGTICAPIREKTNLGYLVVSAGARSEVDKVVVNDEIVTDMSTEVKPEDYVWIATSKLVKGIGKGIDASFGRMALRDIERFSDFCEKSYGVELVIDPHFDEGYLVIENFPLPPGFSRESIPKALALPNFPIQAPSGLYLPAGHPDTETAKRIFTVFDASHPDYGGIENLLRSGWAWVCLRYFSNGSDGKDWNYEFVEAGGMDSLAAYLAFANACLRRTS